MSDEIKIHTINEMRVSEIREYSKDKDYVKLLIFKVSEKTNNS